MFSNFEIPNVLYMFWCYEHYMSIQHMAHIRVFDNATFLPPSCLEKRSFKVSYYLGSMSLLYVQEYVTRASLVPLHTCL